MNAQNQNPGDDQNLDALRQERDALLNLLRQMVNGDVGHATLWKLSQGQGTATADGKIWLAAQAVVERARTPVEGR